METTSPSPLAFTAIDFETANAARASACAIGLARVRGGEVVDTASFLIKPPPGLDEFAPRNVAIHGISPEMVSGAPTWDHLFPEVMSFLGGDDLLAHNAPFDRSVFRQACAVFDLEAAETSWYDTLPIARRMLTLGSYSLPFVAQALDLEELSHHEALADAVQAARIAIALSQRAGADSLSTLTFPVGGGGARGSVRRLRGDGTRTEGDFSGLAATDVMAGESVVFTGKLTLHTRDEARALVEYFGGTTQNSVTKTTTILVSGDLDPRTFRPGADFSRKLQKAMDLAASGQPIEIWTEGELHERLAVGREALEEATRAQRAASRSEWLPNHVIAQARELTEPDLGYSAWLRAALRHPAGRPAADARCLRCEGDFAEDVYWMFLERWVCSPECNEALKRAAKRAWSSAGIARPAAPSYADSYGRR